METLPFPGFPTDMQAQYAALSATARGTAVIVENLFETRYKYAGELKKMGADVTVRGRTAVIRGVEKLHGAEVSACDLRGGAALVIAALKAEGESVVSELWHIDRGYALFDEKLKALGAGIVRTVCRKKTDKTYERGIERKNESEENHHDSPYRHRIFYGGVFRQVSAVYRVEEVTLVVENVSSPALEEAAALRTVLEEAYLKKSTIKADDAAAKSAFENFAYFRLTGFEKDYPGRLVITATEDAEVYAVANGGNYVIYSGDGTKLSVLRFREKPRRRYGQSACNFANGKSCGGFRNVIRVFVFKNARRAVRRYPRQRYAGGARSTRFFRRFRMVARIFSRGRAGGGIRAVGKSGR